MKRKVFLIVLFGLAISLAGMQLAEATPVVFDLNFEYSGGTPPQGTAPWLRATFTDVLVGEVELTVEALGLVENEYVSDWLFNIDEDFEDSVDSLMFTPLPGPLASLGLTANTYSGGGSNSFDIALGFPTAEASRFGAGDSFTFSITSDEISVEAALFDVLNNYPKGPYFETIAYIQGIGPDGSSGWIAQGSGTTPVPEPTTMLFFGLGLIGLVGLGRNRLKK